MKSSSARDRAENDVSAVATAARAEPISHGTDVVIVVPCFDEGKRLHGEAFLACASALPRVRFLFVDDGSRDDTRVVLDALRARAPAVVDVLPLETNGGKAEAVRRGVLQALGGLPYAVGYWDADLATPLDELGRFVELLERRPEVVMVMGSRVALLGRDIRRSPLRHYLGRLFATAASWILGLPVYDTQCGAKLFRADAVREGIFDIPFATRWLLDIEILQRLLRVRRALGPGEAAAGFHELPLEAWRDVRGSKLSGPQMLRAAIDLVRLAARPSGT